MTIDRFVCSSFALLVLTVPVCITAQDSEAMQPSHGIRVAVAVDTKTGQPVTSLAQNDFTILDNKTQRPITAFKVVSEPVHIILLLDAVNMPYEALASTRQGLERYLKSHEGTLPYPTTLTILTDQGAQIVNDFSTNGNLLSDTLHSQKIGLREINRDSAWSGPERLQICLKAFNQVAGFAAGIAGRKVLIWISPGWPLVSGPQVVLGLRDAEQIFNDVVSISNQLRRDNLTIYNVNPWGVGESLERTDLYKAYLKAPLRPRDVEFGDLGLQVLAIHSGGLAIESNSDVSGNIERCVNELRSWYEIEFEPLPADKPNEYHHLEVRLDQPSFSAHTIDGYYANPKILEPPR